MDMISRNPLSFIEKIFDWSLPVLITSVTFLVFIQVLLRYLFNAPLMGIEELLMFPTTWLYMFGAVKASAEKTQIVARVLEVFIKRQKSVFLLRAAAAAASSAVLIWLMKWGYDFFKYVLRVWKESPTLYIPTFWYEGVVFISIIFILFYTICEIVEYMKLYSQTPADLLISELSC
jgi:TRAP-type C4-dicarboxylate transport system permease small subunit